MDLDYFIVNVFSEIGIEGGNQLAVIPEASNLSDRQMQAIAKEFNFSETTFVTRIGEQDADVRIFTPQKEIEYAGHPTIGTLYTLERMSRESGADERTRYDLVLKGGRVRGEFQGDGEVPEMVSFTQVPGKRLGEHEDREGLLDLLGIGPGDVTGPFVIAGVTSMKFLFVQMNDAGLVDALEPDLSGLSKGRFQEEDISVYPFSFSDGVARARFFVPLYGIPEDPATGGIQSSFGVALHALGLIGEGVSDVKVEQGDAMGRSSRIYDRFEIKEGEITTVTGGKCHLFAGGQLSI